MAKHKNRWRRRNSKGNHRKGNNQKNPSKERDHRKKGGNRDNFHQDAGRKNPEQPSGRKRYPGQGEGQSASQGDMQGNQYKKVSEMQPGEVAIMYVPFQQNTPDYCNGHDPGDIRERPYENRLGQSGKKRPVVFMGQDSDNNMVCLPISSKFSDKMSHMSQYQLKDNEAVNSYNNRDNKHDKSYIKLSNLQALPTVENRNYRCTGKLSEIDYQNTMHRMTNEYMYMKRDMDVRGIVPDNKVEMWEHTYLNGYNKQVDDRGDTIYKRANRTVTRTPEGMVHYHKERSEETVKRMIGEREGIHLSVPQTKEELSSFAESVHGLSDMKREQIQQ